MSVFSYHNFDSIISIDFGTTFSGTCYAFTRNLKEKKDREKTKDINIIHVTNWPEQKGSKLIKVPTVCIYNRKTNKLFKWGAEAYKYWHDPSSPRDNFKYIEQFKLKLQTTRTKGKQIILENDDDSLHVKATTDFLKAIYEHTFKSMEGAGLEKNAVDKSRTRFVLTVPAQWTDDDRKLMRLLCIDAGIISDKDHENRMHIVNESFASTIYCERELANNSESNFEKGTRYLICDAGGGTVDLATYESTGKDPELHGMYNGRCQLTFDRGKGCGSVFVDKNMTDLLLKIIFVDEEERKKYSEKDRDILGNMLKNFIENDKPNFKYTKEDEEAYDNRDTNTDEDDDDDQYIHFHFSIRDIQNLSNSTKSQSKYFGPTMPKTEFFNISEARKNNDRIEFIRIPKKIIKAEVFDPVVETTIKLIKRQIIRSNYNISKTFLLGGFGKSVYLQKELERTVEESKTGKVVTDNAGEAAAMRGALYHGIDFIRRSELTDVVKVEYADEQNDHDVLISLDIGYEHSSATYTMLKGSKESKNIVKWPGDADRENIDWPNHRRADKFKVPTALFETNEVENLAVGSGGGLKWGYEALASRNNNNGNLIVPSSHLALFRDDFKEFLTKYLELLHEYVFEFVSKETSVTEKQKYRYCLTMENNYRFFNSKRDMRNIAIDAKIINENDSSKKLLLINREDACAIYHENAHFGAKTDFYKSIFLQLFMARDHVRLTVHESTAIANLEQKKEEQKKERDPFSFLNDEDKSGRLFRNVRTANSITFPFNFVDRLIYNFDSFITKGIPVKKPRSNEKQKEEPTSKIFKCLKHGTHEGCFDYTETSLRKGFLDFVQKTLDFSDNSKNQTIFINKERGCKIEISVHDIIEFVFKITYKELAFILRRHISEKSIASVFNINKIFLLGTAVESEKDEANQFMLKILAKEISDIVSLKEDRIKLVEINQECEGQEVLKGASLYGLNPENHTQKISRKTYAISVIAFQPKKTYFETDITVKEGEEKNLKKTEFEFFKEDKAVSLETQRDNESTVTEVIQDDDLVVIMDKNTPTSYFDELYGINRRFFAREECLVYATIYVKEDEDEVIKSYKTNNEQFRKIHQFEVEVRKNEKLKHVDGESRLGFYIRLNVDNNDTKFKVDSANNVFTVPEYRYRDEFLVTNIY